MKKYILALCLLLSVSPAYSACSLHNDTKAQILERYKAYYPDVTPRELTKEQAAKLSDMVTEYAGYPKPDWFLERFDGLLFDTGKEDAQIEFSVYDRSGNLCGDAKLTPEEWRLIFKSAADNSM